MIDKSKYLCTTPFYFTEVQDTKQFLCCPSWLKENIDNMPEVTVSEQSAAEAQANKDFEAITTEVKTQDSEDVPFSSPGSLTNEDKLAVIMKLAKDKLGATDLQSVKDKVMGATGIAFIPLQYDKITETLSAM